MKVGKNDYKAIQPKMNEEKKCKVLLSVTYSNKYAVSTVCITLTLLHCLKYVGFCWLKLLIS